MPEIRVENLSKSYGPQHALHDVGFVMESGKKTVILGPSGAGKTTLLRCIAGLLKPESGKIFFDEKDVTDIPAGKRNAAMIFQSAALFEHTRIKDNIGWGLHKLGYSKSEIEQMVKSSAALLHIDHLLERYPGMLSGGEKQRASIARALVRKPDLLLLDEPFSSLDARLSEELQQEVVLLQAQNKMTMVQVTHDQREAMNMADTVVLMNEGKIAAIGTPAALYDNPPDLFTARFLGSPAINVIERSANLFTRLKAVYDIPDHVKMIGIRPQDFRIEVNENGLCEVRRCISGYGSYEIRALCMDTPLTLITEKPLSEGCRFQICAPKEKLHLFDESGLSVTTDREKV